MSFFNTTAKIIRSRLPDKLSLILSALGFLLIIISSGFDLPKWLSQVINVFFYAVIAVGLLSAIARQRGQQQERQPGPSSRADNQLEQDQPKPSAQINRRSWSELIYLGSTLCLTLLALMTFFSSGEFNDALPKEVSALSLTVVSLPLAVFLVFIHELFGTQFSLSKVLLRPDQFLILGFLGLIVIGALLLLMPNATVEPISILDALFTATSAVCVTGLMVVESGSNFTFLGQVILLVLIQLGGLGLVTFVTCFGYLFTSEVGYDTQLSLTKMSDNRSLEEIFSLLKSVVYVTLGAELLTAVLIFALIHDLSLSGAERVFFALFYAISTFCNAGFSTLDSELFSQALQSNYPLQLVIAASFIIGGIGFVVIHNTLGYLRHRFKWLSRSGRRQPNYKPWLIHLDGRIALVTTAALLLIGFIGILWFEFDGVLASHDTLAGKVMTGFLTAATPRSVGFDSVDMAQLTLPSTVLIIFLMWIGSSPNSTGGGIKTSTLAVAVLNIWSTIRGQSRIEVWHRQIAEASIRRAFATIWLSLISIGLGVMMISALQPQLSLREVVFECFAAYSTAGLSIGVTADLDEVSQGVVMVLMFVGRLSMLTVLTAFLSQSGRRNRRYPTEHLTIN